MKFSFKTVNWANILAIALVSLVVSYVVQLTLVEDMVTSENEDGDTVVTTGKRFALMPSED